MASVTSGSLTATGSVTLTLAQNEKSAAVQISGTYGSVTGLVEKLYTGASVWEAPTLIKADAIGQESGSVSPSDNDTRSWYVDTTGCQKVRYRVTAISSGQVDVNINAGDFDIAATTPIQTGSSSSIAGDYTLSSGGDLIFSGTTGQNEIHVSDNLADALSVKIAGGADFMVFVSTDSGEKVQFSQDVDFPAARSITILDNSATALVIKEGSNSYLTFVTTDSGEKIVAAKAVEGSSSIKSLHATAGLGYGTGAGGTVTQATNKTTGVTLNKAVGQITMNGAALADNAEATFTVTNSAVAATDVVVVNHSSAGTAGAYWTQVSEVGAGSFKITVGNLSGGSLSEAIVLSYAVIKGASS